MELEQHSPKPTTPTSKIHFCSVRLTHVCQERNGQFAACGQRGKAPRYCPECAQTVRRAQIQYWQGKKRQELAPAEYQRQYGSTYSLDAEQRERWRAQKRRQNRLMSCASRRASRH